MTGLTPPAIAELARQPRSYKMPTLILTRIEAAGNKPKLIDE
jgi:hypothetical protein